MSKVALRLYNREIETLIDQGHIDEAIAHCQHILKTYPKHLETYRLLGKAYLEARRYVDSADIFQRVLLAVPDDFVSHLGMSIVSDEQKDLDGAIWHMERAFEISSTNAGVQGELRRLRGRRDGMEPPKIQLTRGALAQIYTKGGEYQQAIAEIKAVLAEDPTRSDMKTLLARAYFRAGMRNEATQACIDLLKEYPYNLDANRILVEILPGTSMAQGVDQYKRRIESLDPYLAMVTGSVFNAENVPDNAVNIERLEWDPNAQPAPSWNMSDVGSQSAPESAVETPADQIPDWMKQSGWGQSTGEFKEGQVNFDEPEAEPPVAGAGELAAADIPDWLKAMAPPGATTTNEPAAKSTDDTDADLDWLAGLGAPMIEKPAETPAPAPAQPAQPATPPANADDQDWLSSLGATAGEGLAADEGLDWLNNLTPPQEQARTQPVETSQASDESLPDWLSSLEESKPAEPASTLTPEQPSELGTPEPELSTGLPQAEETTPDWLSEFSAQQPAEAASESVPDWMSGLSAPQAPEETTPAQNEPAPDWMSGLTSPETLAEEAPQTPAESAPDWMSGLSSPQTPEETTPSASVPDWMSGLTSPETPEATTPSESAPDWMSGLTSPQTPEETTPSASVPDWMSGLTSSETPEATTPAESTPDWMSGLTTPQASEEETPSGSVPDWMSGLASPQTPEETTPAASASVPDWLKDLSAGEPEQPLSNLVSGPGTSQAEQDESLNWLESLAAKHGAKPEELITNPSERQENVPDWVNKVEETSEPPVAQAASEYVPEKPIEAEAEPMEGELSPLVSGPGTTESEQDDAFKWLENLAAGQGAKAEELLTNPEDRKERAPGWVGEVESPATDLSALISGPGTSSSEQDDALLWLESLAQKQGAKPEELITNPDERKEVAPDWVSQVGQVPDQVVGQEPAQEIPTQPVQTAPEPPVEEVIPPTPVAHRADDEFVSEPLSDLVSGPGTTESEQDDALLWLESLAQKQGAKPEELITNPNERKDVAPDWVSQVGQVPDQIVQPEPTEETPTQPVTPPAEEVTPPTPVAYKAEEEFVSEPLSDLVSGPGTTAAEQDDALLWLESLAQKQGAKPEELITNPNERKEVAPDWVSQVGQEPAQSTEPEKVPSAQAEAPIDQSLAWLQSLDEEEEPIEQEVEQEEPVEQTPVEPLHAESQPVEHDWFKDLEEAAAGATEGAVANEGLDWLDNLKKPIEEPVSETPIELPTQEVASPEPEEQPSVPAKTPLESETPDWLASFGQTEETAQTEVMPWEQEIPAETVHPELSADELQPEAAEEVAPDASGITDWLKNLDVPEQTPSAVEQSAAEPEELPDWLKDTSADDEQPLAPEPALGWMPTAESSMQPPVDEEKPVSSLPVQEEERPVETTPAERTIPEPVAQAVPTPPLPPRPVLRQTGALGSDKDSLAVQRARDLLGRGGLDGAMSEYTRLIKKGKLLEEVIYDLQEAVYSHPVDVVVWQTLGDAYMRSNRLQDALDAYSKAEELLR